ncbi:MAG: carbamoyltransferase HypF, partial [Gammaproteobacteria bacterium]
TGGHQKWTFMKRLLIQITGQVQGVGFRPFVYRLACQHKLKGYISNTKLGVLIDIQGEISSIATFQAALITSRPKHAKIDDLTSIELAVHDVQHFTIKQNTEEASTALALAPDTSICEECLQELFDPNNRRYQYPFLHCVNCGPRFSLLQHIPFERANTTMSDFIMCVECQNEYNDPSNKRFYSQTNCCATCGPKLQLLNNENKFLAENHDAMKEVVTFLRQGKIVAIKNTGGYQLVVDATNEYSVKLLRHLKHRLSKPFAILMPNLEQIKQVVKMNNIAETLLSSSENPIVLLRKNDLKTIIAPSVAPNSPYYGIMLPHTALQHLLMKDFNRPLIATSGNISGKPLCITEVEAFAQLHNIADAFLIHNRHIEHGLDDSIIHIIDDQPMLMRRARGYIPYIQAAPVSLENSLCLLGAGGQLKNSFALVKNNKVYLSQYIGNLDNVGTCQRYEQEIKRWETLLNIKSEEGIGDKHPDYYTTGYLQKSKIKIKNIQHHHAHVWSGMIDNQLQFPVSAFAWDGTGFGDDGTVWGGEAFLVKGAHLQRFASIYPFPLPGGEKAIREPRRMVLGILQVLSNQNALSTGERWLQRAFQQEELSLLQKALVKGINAPLCSSVGRLFDAVSALLNCCLISTFEGQAALALEELAGHGKTGVAHYSLNLLKEKDLWLLDWRPLFTQLLADIEWTVPASSIALAFHEALAQGMVELAKIMNQEKVLLTGGVMQNKLLVETAITKLRHAGFTPYWHHNIPPNDGGLAVGQVGAKLYEIDMEKQKCV